MKKWNNSECVCVCALQLSHVTQQCVRGAAVCVPLRCCHCCCDNSAAQTRVSRFKRRGFKAGCIYSEWLFQRRPSHLVLHLISLRLRRCRRHQVHPLLLQQAVVSPPCVNSCFSISRWKMAVKNARCAETTVGPSTRAPLPSAIILQTSIDKCTRNVLVLLRSRQFQSV